MQEAALQPQLIITAHHRLKIRSASILVGCRFEDVGVARVGRQFVGEVIQQASVRRDDVVLCLGHFRVFEGARVLRIEHGFGVGAFPAAIAGAEHGMPLICEVEACGQVAGLLLDDVLAVFNAGIQVLVLGNRAHVLPVWNRVVGIRVEVDHQGRSVVVLGLAVTQHQLVVTPEQGVSARDIDVDGGHFLFADEVAAKGRHTRAIGIGEAAPCVIDLAFGITGAMGVGRFQMPVTGQLLVQGGEGGFVLHRP